MPKKRNDALPRDKLLVLYQVLILQDRRHFLSDLAGLLGCSTQTVTRLIGVIERHLGKDADIEAGMDGRRRFFRLRSTAQDHALGFSFEELSYLAICRDLAAQFLPGDVASRIDRTLTGLALQLGEQGLSGPPISFRNKGYIDYGRHLPKVSILRKAIEKRQVCEIRYKANGREAGKTYRYAPGRLQAMNGSLYLQGYRLPEDSLLKERPTTFSVHRIADVSPTGEYFRFDAADQEACSFGLNWHEPKRMQVHIAPDAADYVRDRVWSEDQAIEEHPDGSITLTVSTTSEKEFQAWVWSFGGLAKTISDHNCHSTGENHVR